MTDADDPPGKPYLSSPEEAAFSQFYMGEMPRLVAFTMSLGADLSEACDIAQQAFVNAYYRWPTIQNPAAYLRTSASRALIRRSSEVRRERPVAELPDSIAGPDPMVAKVEFTRPRGPSLGSNQQPSLSTAASDRLDARWLYANRDRRDPGNLARCGPR